MRPLTDEELRTLFEKLQDRLPKVKGFIATDPQLPVYVAGDRDASYQTVYEVLTLLQREAKVSRAGLMGNPAESQAK